MNEIVARTNSRRWPFTNGFQLTLPLLLNSGFAEQSSRFPLSSSRSSTFLCNCPLPYCIILHPVALFSYSLNTFSYCSPFVISFSHLLLSLSHYYHPLRLVVASLALSSCTFTSCPFFKDRINSFEFDSMYTCFFFTGWAGVLAAFTSHLWTIGCMVMKGHCWIVWHADFICMTLLNVYFRFILLFTAGPPYANGAIIRCIGTRQ